MVSLRGLVFLAAVAVVLLAVVAYVPTRVAEAARLGRRTRLALLPTLLAIVQLPVLLRALGFVARDVGNGWLATVGFGVGLALLIAAGLLLPFDALRRALPQRRPEQLGAATDPPSEPESATPRSSVAVETEPAIPEPMLPTAGQPAPATLTRRELVERSYVGLAVGTGAATALYGLTFGRHDYVVEDVPIPIRNLPRSLDGYTIVQLSDLHVGVFVGDGELNAGVELVRRAQPDLIVLTGDLVDHDSAFVPQLARFTRRLVELGARDGVVAVPGNHDYYTGVDLVLDGLRRSGVRVLRNDGLTIGDRGGRFALLGVDDTSGRRHDWGTLPDLDAALAQVAPDLPRVLLCHNPELFPEAAERVDLQLSGHTHGGQVNLIVRPAELVMPHGYFRGHYMRGASQIYVNRGFGTAGPPARIDAPPEISRIVLVAA